MVVVDSYGSTGLIRKGFLSLVNISRISAVLSSTGPVAHTALVQRGAKECNTLISAQPLHAVLPKVLPVMEGTTIVELNNS